MRTNASVIRIAHACATCKGAFEGPHNQRYCRRKCKERARYEREILRPGVMDARRARFRTWSYTHRRVTGANMWLRGQLIYGPHLPGGGCELTIGSQLIPHKDLRLVHGMLSHLIEEPHHTTDPSFSLVPWPGGCGWSVYFWREDLLRKLAGTSHVMRFGNRDGVRVTFGPAARVRTPNVTKRGHMRVRVDSLTPVVITNTGRSSIYTAPTSDTLLATLAQTLRPRLGLGNGTEDLRLELLERHTEPVSLWMGEKMGTVRGWEGYAVLDVNAPARWLLEVASRGPGLGGRTAFGFGRVRVTEG